MGNNLNLAIAGLGDLDGLAEVADTAVNLDLLVEELLKGRDVKDLVASGLRSVDDELSIVRDSHPLHGEPSIPSSSPFGSSCQTSSAFPDMT